MDADRKKRGRRAKQQKNPEVQQLIVRWKYRNTSSGQGIRRPLPPPNEDTLKVSSVTRAPLPQQNQPSLPMPANDSARDINARNARWTYYQPPPQRREAGEAAPSKLSSHQGATVHTPQQLPHCQRRTVAFADNFSAQCCNPLRVAPTNRHQQKWPLLPPPSPLSAIIPQFCELPNDETVLVDTHNRSSSSSSASVILKRDRGEAEGVQRIVGHTPFYDGFGEWQQHQHAVGFEERQHQHAISLGERQYQYAAGFREHAAPVDMITSCKNDQIAVNHCNSNPVIGHCPPSSYTGILDSLPTAKQVQQEGFPESDPSTGQQQQLQGHFFALRPVNDLQQMAPVPFEILFPEWHHHHHSQQQHEGEEYQLRPPKRHRSEL